MIALRTTVVVEGSPDRVWADLADLPSHHEWMRDAHVVRMTSSAPVGIGSTFEADTRLGPFRVLDRMEIVEWRPGEAMAVRHSGAVTGEGRFTIEPVPPDHCVVTWVERLAFPWWLGGRVGEWLGTPILRSLFRANLAGFAARFD